MHNRADGDLGRGYTEGAPMQGLPDLVPMQTVCVPLGELIAMVRPASASIRRTDAQSRRRGVLSRKSRVFTFIPEMLAAAENVSGSLTPKLRSFSGRVLWSAPYPSRSRSHLCVAHGADVLAHVFEGD